MNKPIATLVTLSLMASAATSIARPAKAKGTVMIPEQFVRRWDPVTFFFATNVGTAAGPEDQPERFVRVDRPHPGAWTWLDRQTLQFKPAEPWPALERFSFDTGKRAFTVSTLMAAPARTIPSQDAAGLDAVSAITLVFPEPVAVEALAQMVTIELRPLPGIDAKQARWLTSEDFAIKTMERKSRSDRATYVLGLESPIPLGTRAVVHYRLSLDDAADESFAELSFSTREPFRIVNVGCTATRYPITPAGSKYTADQSIRCTGDRRIAVELSSELGDTNPVEIRNLIRFAPTVQGMKLTASGRMIYADGPFEWEKLYRVSIVPTKLQDRANRPLDVKGESELYVFFPKKQTYLNWTSAQGVLERFGPQMVPMEGRGLDRVDLRIFRVDPMNRSFWPFPRQPVVVNEANRPPGPGEEPEPHSGTSNISSHGLQAQLTNIGSPPISLLAQLPLKREGSGAKFGLDIRHHLDFIGGDRQPGHYIVGMRRLGGDTARSWIRVQVTDLAITTIEEPHVVRFFVTKLSTGEPVDDAVIRVEGSRGSTFETFVEGKTDSTGSYRWVLPEADKRRSGRVLRISASKGRDVLIIDPEKSPDGYRDNQWSPSRNTWLGWTRSSNLVHRGPTSSIQCHMFTERPIYRPDQPVHIKGYMRERSQGRLTSLDWPGHVVVSGPGGLNWRYPTKLSEFGSFYHQFQEKDLPTGTYSARFETDKRVRHCNVSFSMQAYRVPKFEVRLHGPDSVALDKEFPVRLTAKYYAGGHVAGQTVRWRVTQFPYTFNPPTKHKGFVYSSDARYSGQSRFRSSPTLERQANTDESGSALLEINPAIEPSAQPRTYVVEGTVTGADDQTVTATRRIRALPAFILGLKAPRYVERADVLKPELIVIDRDGEMLEGREVTVRLIARQWHSHLKASDFSDGVARYVTDVVDKKVWEKKVKSRGGPLPVSIPLAGAGVYVVEIEARDRLERAQVVSIDLYAGGAEPVTWAKPDSKVFKIASNQASYAPGETAKLVLESPFQRARALIITEAPDRNEYRWVDVRGGKATVEIDIDKTYVPRVPVHVVLMRGRIKDAQPTPGTTTDLGKPATMASTKWLSVKPTANQVAIELVYPDKAQPADEIDVAVRLTTPLGEPLAGEVTMYLVDQAVLALGTEQRLDPVPDFITPVSTHLEVRGTRNLTLGNLPFAENPGGDAAAESAARMADSEDNLVEKVTVRKNFSPVPYFNPNIIVGSDGVGRVRIKLPDNLTNFKLRVKAASGSERFGFAKGTIAVRLPVIVQPALPRFVRPGDSIIATGLARVVEGKPGPGRAQIKIDGATVSGPTKKDVTFVPNRPLRIEFPVLIPTPEYGADGQPKRDSIKLTFAVERRSDKARDAFAVDLPIRPDRHRVTRRVVADLAKPLVVEAVPEPARKGTLTRSVLISDEPALVRMAAGLDFFLEYPHGGTEHRLSKARAFIALAAFRDELHLEGNDKHTKRAVAETLEWLSAVMDRNGLAAHWPGGHGYVSLSAWVLEMLVEAEQAGFTTDASIRARLVSSLERALRSDYPYFIDGESWTERTMALRALARAGHFSSAYAAELTRRADYLRPESQAAVLQAFALSGVTTSPTVDALEKQVWDAMIVRLYQGREIYGGLQTRHGAASSLILPSESRSLATMTRALTQTDGDNPKVQLLVDALVTLGHGDGWGTTNANAEALLALASRLTSPRTGANSSASVHVGQQAQTIQLGGGKRTGFTVTTRPDEIRVTSQHGKRVAAKVQTSYVPSEPGSRVAAVSKGFVVARTLSKIVGGAPPEKHDLVDPGTTLRFAIGDVIEERVEVVNPKDRHYVAIVVPLAAGLEPLNPHLATSGPEAKPSASDTIQPSYASFLDDRVAYYFDQLAKGTYSFHFRTRATTEGRFTQPAAQAEMMYDRSVFGHSPGAEIEVKRK